MKKSIFAAVLLGIAVFFGGYSNYRDDAEGGAPVLKKLNDLNSGDIRLGLPLGAKAMHVGEAEFTEARTCYFNSHQSAYSALMLGKIDGYLFDSHALDYIATRRPEFTVLPGSVGYVDIAVGVARKNDALLGPINEFIDQYRKDGTYQDMYKRWITPRVDKEVQFEIPAMPAIAAPSAPTRTLVVGISSQQEPLCFPRRHENDEYTGFDMELLRRLALHLNVRYVIRDLDYFSLMEELSKGNLDIVIAGLNKTPDRQKRGILFSKNYIDSHIVALVRTSQLPQAKAE